VYSCDPYSCKVEELVMNQISNTSGVNFENSSLVFFLH
jgi:hypothetical protein